MSTFQSGEGSAQAFAVSQNAIEEIYRERRRQVDSKGWTPEHDDGHDAGEIARAAAAYALPPATGLGDNWLNQYALDIWPFHPDGFRHKDRRRDLIRAGALIVAEIERLDRLASRPDSTGKGSW